MSVYALYPVARLLTLVIKAVGCHKAGLFLLEPGSKDFSARLVEPAGDDEPLAKVVIKEKSPVVEYLRRERKPLSRKRLAMSPEFGNLTKSEKQRIRSGDIELFVPLIRRDKLIGILALDKQGSAGYTAEDTALLEDFSSQIAVSIEKEHLQEPPTEYEETLSVINRSSAIITSSLDIQRIYDSFVEELRKLVDVNRAAIVLIEDNEIQFLALSSEAGSAWQLGGRLPIKGTAIERIAANRKAIIEPDLSLESHFTMGEYHLREGMRSVAYVPLVVRDEVIGTLIVASQHPDAYAQKQIDILEQLASRIAVPVENSRLYAKAQWMARIDELTGLLNRRSLDEIINSEVSRHSRYGGVLSLTILDLDSMKTVNDRHGHLAGDKLLGQIGLVLKRSIRRADQAFRYGGDEFAVLLPQTSIDAAMHVAERIRRQVASATRENIPCTASLGLASWPTDGVTANEIIAAADAALYQAKRSGGNRIQRYQATSLISNYMVTATQKDDDSEALSTIYFMAAAVDARDHYTGDHSRKVNKYAVALAKALNLDSQEINRISACALLHDIGKVGISDEILNKPGKLTAAEWKVIKSHPQLGATIASHVHQLATYIPGILYHHERYDGNGYPEGLKGEDIPHEARILAIADAFAAMTSNRHYSAALSYEETIAEIRSGAGTQFDPGLAEVFLSIIEETVSIQEGITGVRRARVNATPITTGGFK